MRITTPLRSICAGFGTCARAVDANAASTITMSRHPRRFPVSTLRSPGEGESGAAADAALRKAAGDPAIHDDILAQSHLATHAHGIFATEGAQFAENANFLS